jgi:hypothetical protein
VVDYYSVRARKIIYYLDRGTTRVEILTQADRDTPQL